MAARTPASIIIENTGSSTMHIATFSDVDDGDTWASGLDDVIGFWGVPADSPTSGQLAAVDIAESSGTFTFHAGEDNRELVLHILTKS